MNKLHEVYMEITSMEVDAIVNAVNESLLKTSGLTLPEITVPGDLQVTPGGPLPCRHILHTCVPIWDGEHAAQEELLARCYRSALAKAREIGCKYVAMPILGSDMGGFPMALALQVAKKEIRAFLTSQPDMDIYLVIRKNQTASYTHTITTHQSVQAYITQRMSMLQTGALSPLPDGTAKAPSQPKPKLRRPAAKSRRPSFFGTLIDLLTSRNLPVQDDFARKVEIDESFSEMLMRLIDERGITDAQCYNKAGVDRRVFARIRSGKDSSGRPYQPSKPTALAFAVALELSMEDTNELLRKAGYALSPCYKFDIIVEYFIKNRIYDLYEINLMLYEFDQPLLGNRVVS